MPWITSNIGVQKQLVIGQPAEPSNNQRGLNEVNLQGKASRILRRNGTNLRNSPKQKIVYSQGI